MDRDGVINSAIISNRKPFSPKNFGELEVLPGVVESISLLKQNNFIPVVVTNQPDVARGLTDIKTVQEIHKYLRKLLGIEEFYVCVHDETFNCNCRKPKPGLILESALKLKINLNQSYLVGDRWKDVAAGQAVGLKSYFIDYSYDEKNPSQPYTKVHSLLEAVLDITGEGNEFKVK